MSEPPPRPAPPREALFFTSLDPARLTLQQAPLLPGGLHPCGPHLMPNLLRAALCLAQPGPHRNGAAPLPKA